MCLAAQWSVHRTAFLISPRYPQRYPPNSECVCRFVTQRNQRLLVRVVADSVLQWTPGCRSDVLVVYDGSEQTLVRCGHLPVGLNVTSRTNTILVAFRSDQHHQHKGFWLAVEGRYYLHNIHNCSSARAQHSLVIILSPLLDHTFMRPSPYYYVSTRPSDRPVPSIFSKQ